MVVGMGMVVPVPVGGQLGPGEHTAVTSGAMIVGVTARIAAGRRLAGLVAGDLTEAGGAHVIQTHVQPTVGHNLVGVSANVVALAAMEV